MACKYLLLLQLATLSCSLVAATYCEQEELWHRRVSPEELKPSYDYIIAGGGQSGLVVASRLSEDPKKSVLVVEYGTFDNDPAQIEPPSATNWLPRNLFNVTSVPLPGLNNRTGSVFAAAVVGGGSTINGMFFDRGAAEDYDNWEKLGNPGWGWKGVFPYFKKSTKFNVPVDPAIVSEFNITWDASAYGDGPIQVTYPPWQWPATKIQFQAWRDLGIPVQHEHAAGKAYNVFWLPNCIDPNSRRSYARSGYYEPHKTRPNLHLLTFHRVNEVLFSKSKRAEAVTIQARGTPNGSDTITVKATQEVILSAGWLHTPQILQRSGIGPSALLKQAGVPVVVDLPGVGSNLQDHPTFGASYNYVNNTVPNQSSLFLNATFRDWAIEQWEQRRGPLSMGVGNAMIQAPLPTIDPEGYRSTVREYLQQSAPSVLPKSYTNVQVGGYVAQRKVLAASYGSSKNSVLEIPFSGNNGHVLILMKPLSRGTVLLNSTDRYAEPVIDFGTNLNPLDVRVATSAIKFYRRWQAAPSMQQLGPVEMQPGVNVTSDAQLTQYVTNGMGAGAGHSCGTATMMPKNLGGVVSPQLSVYGVTGLSVADISIIPLIPAAHTCATVYAIAEKAADLIKARAR